MKKLFTIKNKKIGLPPGTLMKPTTQASDKFHMYAVNYSQEIIEELEAENIDECIAFINKKNNTWIHLEGVNDNEVLKKIGSVFTIHNLILEDIQTQSQRPKLDNFDSDYIFLVTKHFVLNNKTDNLTEEQVSFILGRDTLISITTGNINIFDPIKKRLHTSTSLVRQKKTDYLCYALLDIIVDNYYVILEELSEKLESLEDELLNQPTQDTFNQLYEKKNQVLILQKSIRPLRMIIVKFKRLDAPFFNKKNEPYLNDLADHVIQIIDTIQTLREIISNMFDMYLSLNSNKMNDVMKVLTIIGTIFIPLSFITSFYGMNFKFMPELDLKIAYPLVILLNLLVATGMILYFKKKKWF